MNQETSAINRVAAMHSESVTTQRRRRLRACLIVGAPMVLALLLTYTALPQAEPVSAASGDGCTGNTCVFTVSQPTDDAGTVVPYSGGSECRGDLTGEKEIYFGECASGEEVISGFRFNNVTLTLPGDPTRVYLEFTVDGPYEDAMGIGVFGENSANPTTFSPGSMPRDRQLTGTSVTWSISDRWNFGEVRQTPDLSLLFSSIRAAGWQNGNAMAFVFRRENSTGGHARRVYAYERPEVPPDDTRPARLVFEFGSVAPTPYYWGADTIDDKYWHYCTDGLYHEGKCPSNTYSEPLDFYGGKIGTGACTLENKESDFDYCGTWTGPEFHRYVRDFGDQDHLSSFTYGEPEPDLPATASTRYGYWYLRGPDSGNCGDNDCRRAVEVLQDTPAGLWCEQVIHPHDTGKSLETMYGCLQAYAFLDTYQIPQHLEGVNSTEYTSDYMHEFAGNTLFVDIEEPNGEGFDPPCGWDSKNVAKNRAVFLGFLYGMQAGIRERGLNKNIGIYTSKYQFGTFLGEGGYLDPFQGHFVVWATGTPWVLNPPLYDADMYPLNDVTGFAPSIFAGAHPRYGLSIADSLPVVWQFHLDQDFDVAIQDPARGFTPRTSNHPTD